MRAFSVAALIVTLWCSACGGGGGQTPTPSATGPQARVIAVKLTDAGCTPDNFTLSPGTVIFSVTNTGSTDVEEMQINKPDGTVLGDVEGVLPGETRSFVVTLTPGSYPVRCPEDAKTGGTVVVR